MKIKFRPDQSIPLLTIPLFPCTIRQIFKICRKDRREIEEHRSVEKLIEINEIDF